MISFWPCPSLGNFSLISIFEMFFVCVQSTRNDLSCWISDSFDYLFIYLLMPLSPLFLSLWIHQTIPIDYQSKGYFSAAVLEALTQHCGSIPVRFDTLKPNLNKPYYASAKCLLQ